MAAYQTVLEGVRSAVTKPEVAASLPPEIKKLFGAVVTGFTTLAGGNATGAPADTANQPRTGLDQPRDARLGGNSSSSSSSGGNTSGRRQRL